MISASSLERVKACPGSETLPHVETPNDLAERGRAVHAYLADVITGTADAIAKVPEDYRDICAAIDTTSIPRVGSFADEVAFAWNVERRTARILDATDRAYKIELGEIPGTADAVGIAEDAVVIIDWKGAWSKATSAADNLQLRFYALCAANIYGKASAIVAIARVAEDRIRWDVAELSIMDLETFADELREIGPGPKFREGEHCRYCPAFDSCPAKQSLIRSFSSPEIVEAHAEVSIDTMDDDARAEVWRKLKAFEDVVSRAKERMRESIAHRPIRIGDTAIVMVEEDRRSITDVDAAAAIVEVAIGNGAAIMKKSTSLTAIEAVCGEHAKAIGRKKADVVCEVMTALESVVKTSKIQKVKEIDAKKLLQNS